MQILKKTDLTVHTGLLHPELERAFIDDLKTIKRKDPLEPVVVLIGSNLLKEYLLWRLIAAGLDLLNIRLVTFTDLAADLSLIKRITDNRPILPSEGEFACALKAIETLTEPNYFQEVSDRNGFIYALAATFTDLDEALIGQIDKTVHLDRTGKLKALARLRREYMKHIQDYQRLLENLQPVTDTGDHFRKIYQTERLLIYGLYDFNAAQRALLESLAGEIEFIVYLPFQTAGDFGGAFKYAELAHQFFNELRPDVTTIQSGKSDREPGYGDYLFRYDPSSQTSGFIPTGRSLSIFRAENPSSEIRGIVGRINELALYENMPLSRMGVMLWRPESYLESLRYELDRVGIPFVDTIGMSLDQTAEGRAFISLLNMFSRSLERRAVVDLVASAELNLSDPDSAEPDEHPDPVAWEVISAETGILEGDLQRWQAELDHIETRLDQDDRYKKRISHLVTISQVRLFREFIERIFERLEELPDKGTWDQFAAGAVAIAEDFLPDNNTVDLIIYEMESLSRLGELTGQITRDRFIAAVGHRLGSVRQKRGRYAVDGVTLCDRMASRGLTFDLLFIPGLALGLTPAAPREDPVLNDYERMRINRLFSPTDRSSLPKRQDPLPLKSARLDEEKLLFTLAVDAAEERLVLSYPSRDIEGNDLLPSRFLHEICRVAVGTPVESGLLDELDFFEDDTTEPSAAILHRRSINPGRFPLDWVRANVPAADRETALKEIYSGDSTRFQRCIDVAVNRLSGDRFTAWDGVMPVGWKASETQQSRFSVTSLEHFATCPFRYYVRHILKVEPWEEPELLLEPPAKAVGSLVHSILEEFYTRALNEKRIPLIMNDLDWARDNLKDILSNEIKRFRARYPIPRALWDIEADRLERRLLRFVKEDIGREDEFRFHKAEVELDQLLAFETDDGKSRIQITGKIDRLDFSDDIKALRIIDYKTGQVQARADKFDGGRSLQLPVYLKAMLDRFPDVDPASCAAEYLKIDQQGGIKSVPFKGSTLIEGSGDLGQLINTITESISEGIFPPLQAKNNCNNCEAQYLCDLRSRKSFEWRKNDPRVAEILEVREIE